MRLLSILALACTAAAVTAAEPAGKLWVYFGTYTNKSSKGIYRSTFDAATGKLSDPELAAEVKNPSFLTIHPSGRYLYAVGEQGGPKGGTISAFALDPATRRHYLALVQRRTGQARFRESVLDAYASRCTLCRLRHRELLDAAHIVSYAEGGTHLVTNGMSMCTIHHRAYDLDIVGVRPDGVAEVRADVLEEVDGPMLRHGLQEVHGARLYLPRSPAMRPSVEGLERRYERFRGKV